METIEDLEKEFELLLLTIIQNQLQISDASLPLYIASRPYTDILHLDPSYYANIVLVLILILLHFDTLKSFGIDYRPYYKTLKKKKINK